MLAFQPTFYDIGNSCSMEEAGVEVITAEVKGGDAGVTMTNETACQVATLKRSSDYFFLFRLKSWECSLPSQPTLQSRHTESILGTVQVTQNVKK